MESQYHLGSGKLVPDLVGMVPLLSVALPVLKPRCLTLNLQMCAKPSLCQGLRGLALPWRADLLLEAEEASWLLGERPNPNLTLTLTDGGCSMQPWGSWNQWIFYRVTGFFQSAIYLAASFPPISSLHLSKSLRLIFFNPQVVLDTIH